MPQFEVNIQALRTKASGTSRVSTALSNLLVEKALTQVSSLCTGSATGEACHTAATQVGEALRAGAEDIASFGVGLATGATNFENADQASGG